MFKSTIIKVETFNSKEGKPCKIVWLNNPKGLPCKTFVKPELNVKDGDPVLITFEPDWNCNARIVVYKE